MHLTRTDENVDEIEALAKLLGDRVDARGDARRPRPPGSPVADAGPGRAPCVHVRPCRPARPALVAAGDHHLGRRLRRRRPSAGRRIVVVAWYAKELPGDADDRGGNQGSRLTFFDLDTRRYRHVLLVVPGLEDGELRLEPLRVHAGGIVWHGPYLHVAATSKGFYTCRARRPVPGAGRAVAGVDIRLSLRAAGPLRLPGGDRRGARAAALLLHVAGPRHVAARAGGRRVRQRRRGPGGWRASRSTRRRSSSRPTDDGLSRPAGLDEGVGQMQGAVVARGRFHVTVSHGPRMPGSVYVGQPGSFTPAPVGDADGARGHRLLAFDRPAVVGQRASPPAVDLLDAAVAVRPVRWPGK